MDLEELSLEELDNLSYEVWICAQTARECFHEGKITGAKMWLDKIKYLLLSEALSWN